MFKHTTNRTRREVLAAALGTVGAGVAWAPPAAKIGCGTVSFRKSPLKEAMERVRRAGYAYVETQAVGPWCPHIDVWKDDPTEFRRLAKAMGFQGVSALWAPDGAIIPNAKSVAGISQAIRWAAEAGIPVVNAGDGRKPSGLSDSDALKLCGERLGPILQLAGKCRVFLAIEPHGTFSLTAEGLQALMELSKSRWFGINYDTANVHRAIHETGKPGAYAFTPYGKRRDEVATLRAVVKRVVHVHLKDVIASKCVALGEGEVNIRGCIRVLNQNGYKGVFSLESEGESGAEEAQQMITDSRKYLLGVFA